jgi:hypothetical protein
MQKPKSKLAPTNLNQEKSIILVLCCHHLSLHHCWVDALVAECNKMGPSNYHGSFIQGCISLEASRIVLKVSGMLAADTLFSASGMFAADTLSSASRMVAI